MKALICLSFVLALKATPYKKSDLPEARSYQNYKVYQTYPNNDDEIDFIKSFGSMENYDFWTDIKKGEPVEIMVSPENERTFEKQMAAKDIKYVVFISNVQELINLEKVFI